MRTLLALATLFTLTACNVTVENGQPQIIEAPRGAIETPPSAPEEPTYTILRNYGYLDRQLVLDFTAHRINKAPARFDWFLYSDDGFLDPNGKRIKCASYLEIKGTATKGQLIVSDAWWGWVIAHTNWDAAQAYCESFEGVYEYEVDAEGLWIDGVLYPEVIED